MLLLFSIAFLMAGIFCTAYILMIIAYSGPSTAFLWFWMLAGIGSYTASALFFLVRRKHVIIHRAWYGVFFLFLLCAATVFLLVEGKIYISGREQTADNADYMIVLGAQVRGRTVSRALKSRLDTASKYLKKNTGTVVIVSGGQGSGEEITEALAMKNYLESKGISKDRILQEDKSVNTYENLKNSKRILDERQWDNNSPYRAIIVTSRFHIFRATSIAKSQGIKGVQGLGAPNDDILTLNYYVREFFGVGKDLLLGNMKVSPLF